MVATRISSTADWCLIPLDFSKYRRTVPYDREEYSLESDYQTSLLFIALELPLKLEKISIIGIFDALMKLIYVLI